MEIDSNTAKRKRKINKTLLGLCLAIFAAIILYPIYITLVVSFDDTIRFTIPNPPPFFPKKATTIFYEMVLVNIPFFRYYINTMLITVAVLILKLAMCVLAAYALSKGKFKLKGLYFTLIVATMMIPFQAILLPLYLMFNQLRMLDSWLPVIIMSTISPITVFLLKQYMDELPYTLREAAIIDGAGDFRICWQIYIPLCGPVIATVVILTMIGEWNNYLWPYIVINRNELYNIPVGLAKFSFDKAVIISPRSAAALLGSVPMIIAFLFFQKYIVQSIAAT